jgi:hypothetical protein
MRKLIGRIIAYFYQPPQVVPTPTLPVGLVTSTQIYTIGWVDGWNSCRQVDPSKQTYKTYIEQGDNGD